MYTALSSIRYPAGWLLRKWEFRMIKRLIHRSGICFIYFFILIQSLCSFSRLIVIAKGFWPRVLQNPIQRIIMGNTPYLLQEPGESVGESSLSVMGPATQPYSLSSALIWWVDVIILTLYIHRRLWGSQGRFHHEAQVSLVNWQKFPNS